MQDIPVKYLFFFLCKLKLCPMQVMVALQAKKQNSEVKLKVKILNSSPVSIFFDKSFLASSPNKIPAIELSESNLQGSLYKA